MRYVHISPTDVNTQLLQDSARIEARELKKG